MNDSTRAPGQAQEQDRQEMFGTWIDCRDKLPQNDDYFPDFVLAGRRGYVNRTPLVLRYWPTLGWTDERGFGVREVTHWMPIPPLPPVTKPAPEVQP